MKTRWMSALALTSTIVVAGCCCLCGDGSEKNTDCKTTAGCEAKADCEAKTVGLMTD